AIRFQRAVRLRVLQAVAESQAARRASRIGGYFDAEAGFVPRGTTATETVDLFRAVSPAEFEDIFRIGGFRAAPGGQSLAGKQFTLSLYEALGFADQVPDAAAIIRVRVPRSTLNQLEFSRSIDPFIFRNGVVTAQPGAQQQLLNQTLITIEHAF
ncbi:MAG: hypothetical protein D6692_11325, partial [Planctomycetota bacterium]